MAETSTLILPWRGCRVGRVLWEGCRACLSPATTHVPMPLGTKGPMLARIVGTLSPPGEKWGFPGPGTPDPSLPHVAPRTGDMVGASP